MNPATLERFMAKVREDPATGCWLWTACVNADGYGKFRHEGQSCLAHRVAYEHFVGPIPAGLHLDHVKARGCTTTSCVAPAHLEPVTCRENLLRGDTLPARNLAKSHCPQNHPYDEVNTYVTRTGMRQCHTCRAAAKRRASNRKAAA